MTTLSTDLRGTFSGAPGVRVVGHSLRRRNEGGDFPARCQCGETSSVSLSSRAKRKDWQRAHIARVLRNQSAERATSAVVAEQARITLRQLDHWTRQGYLHVDQSGSGKARQWTGDERIIAIDMGRLVRAGFEPEAAALIARRHVEEPTVGFSYELVPGIEVRFSV